MILAYLAGLLTLPALYVVAVSALHVASEGRPGAAWRMLVHRPTLPAWQGYARCAGRRPLWEHYAAYKDDVDVWIEGERAEAHTALAYPCVPVILWPPHLLRAFGLAVGVRLGFGPFSVSWWAR